MPRKLDLINTLYEEGVRELSQNYGNWLRFLRSACWNYKCPFSEQLLIYKQRPDATAVLKIERWNKSFGRWVNKGAHGIAVFDYSGYNVKLTT